MLNFKAVLLLGLLALHTTHAVEYNIALNKVVSTSKDTTHHLATFANDQDLNTYVQIIPESTLANWIRFDLKGVYNVKKIIIWPTDDYADYFFARVFIYVRLITNINYNSSDVLCAYENPVKGIAYNCSTNNNLVKGRYVLLKKESNYVIDILNIAEVAILTEDTDFLVPITGEVEQSHVLFNKTFFIASNAIDEDLRTCLLTTQEAVENWDIPGWWRADLGAIYQVSTVKIHDYYAEYDYRGFYSVYVDPGGFTKLQLCSVFNHSSYQFNSFLYHKCSSVLTGRYLTVEKISSAYRQDALSFCEIQVVAIHKESAYTLPKNYLGISTTTSTTFAADTCSNNCSSCEQREKLLEKEKLITEMEKAFQKKETEKIVIGVVVGLLTAIVFIILGFVGGYMYHQKKNMKPMETNIYEKTKEENVNQHVYSDLNNTPMTEINTYYNENK